MAIRNWLHKQLFPDFERWEQWQEDQWRNTQREAAVLRLQIANRWWCPPPGPRRDDDELVYAGWYHPEQRDAHDNYHTVVVRYPFGHQVLLEPQSGDWWHSHPSDEFSWGYSGGGPHALAVALLVHALRGRTNGVCNALARMGEHLPVGPFIDVYLRKLPIDQPWELTQSEIVRWANDYVQKAARRDGWSSWPGHKKRDDESLVAKAAGQAELVPEQLSVLSGPFVKGVPALRPPLRTGLDLKWTSEHA